MDHLPDPWFEQGSYGLQVHTRGTSVRFTLAYSDIKTKENLVIDRSMKNFIYNDMT